MSYDPYGSNDEPRLDERYVERLPMVGDEERLKARVQGPAIALIVVGVLNLFFGLYMIVNSLFTLMTPAEKLRANQIEMYRAIGIPTLLDAVEQKTADEVKGQALLVSLPLTVLALLASFLPIIGGICMMSLKFYGLGMSGAICAAIPCMSVTACCGLGEGIGIWALVVLLNPDVKSAFR